MLFTTALLMTFLWFGTEMCSKLQLKINRLSDKTKLFIILFKLAQLDKSELALIKRKINSPRYLYMYLQSKICLIVCE